MTRRAQWAAVGAVLLVLVGGAVAATRVLGTRLTRVTVGARAPDFSASTLDQPPAPRTLRD